MTGKTACRPQFARNRDLIDAKIISNDTTLGRWVEGNEFPKGFLIGPSTRVRTWEEVNLWLSWRASGGDISFANWLERQGKADRLSSSPGWRPQRAADANDA